MLTDRFHNNVAAWFVLACVVADLAAFCGACAGGLTPADRYEIESHDLALKKCRGEGLDAGKEAGWDVYTACKKEAGIE